MAEITDKSTLKNWFKNNEKPTQEQFWAWMDSYWHKDEKIPIDIIEDINNILANKADTEQVNTLLEELESKADRTIVDALQSYIEALIDDREASSTTTYSSEKIEELINQVKPSELIDDELEEGSVNTYSIDKIKELVENSAGGDLQSVTDQGNTTDKEITVQGATLGADSALKNTKFGQGALENNKSSYQNVALGHQAFNKLETGDTNLAVGYLAAQKAVSSMNSTLVGPYAGANAIYLNRDTFIGLSGYSHTGEDFTDGKGIVKKGGNNVYIGDSCALYTINGYGNTFVGAACGQNWKYSGSYNTLLGHGIASMTKASNGDCNVLIGAFAPCNGSFSDTLIIHSQRKASEGGSYAITPLIKGHFTQRTFSLGGTYILNFTYTPDADKLVAEGEKAFEPNKMLVVDAEGKVGVKSLQNSTENNDIIYYSFSDFLCEMPSDNSLNEDNFQIFPELFLNGKTATLILKGCFKFSDKPPLNKTIKLELPRGLKFSKVIEYMDIACYGDKNGKLDMAWLSFKNTADSGLFELTTPPDGASAGMSTPVGALYNFHQTIIFEIG
ncbi:hypothetical protein ETU08_01700 [Apibacter muscae]|uniref:hypothetical protein n=1 Tax=Apibacter muscae TaxID=2509004 RepID=UPI0011AD822F|nr:hypothetical protein [Apibacter muscae]TWP31219.1 hypothetical protein ETU08_01700 [Apibacter muscae]